MYTLEGATQWWFKFCETMKVEMRRATNKDQLQDLRDQFDEKRDWWDAVQRRVDFHIAKKGGMELWTARERLARVIAQRCARA